MASGLIWLPTEIRSLRLAGTGHGFADQPHPPLHQKYANERRSTDGRRKHADRGTASNLLLRHLLIAFPNAD
jgi:hypothetical protein